MKPGNTVSVTHLMPSFRAVIAAATWTWLVTINPAPELAAFEAFAPDLGRQAFGHCKHHVVPALAQPSGDRKHRVEVAKRPDGGEDDAGHQHARMLCRRVVFNSPVRCYYFAKFAAMARRCGALTQEGMRGSWSGRAPRAGAAGPIDSRLTTRTRVAVGYQQ